MSKLENACAPAHSFCSVPRKLTIWPTALGQVLRRPGLDLARHAVQALVQQRAQRPAGAVAREHVEVVDVDVAFAVRRADLRRIDVGQPVVGDHLARDVEDQAAERVALVGVGVDAPVRAVEVLVDRGGDVDQRPAVGAQLGALSR